MLAIILVFLWYDFEQFILKMISGIQLNDIKVFRLSGNRRLTLEENVYLHRIFFLNSNSNAQCTIRESRYVPDHELTFMMQINSSEHKKQYDCTFEVPLFLPKETEIISLGNARLILHCSKIHEEKQVPVSKLKDLEQSYKKDLQEVKEGIANAAVQALENYALSELKEQLRNNIANDLPDGFKAAMKAFIDDYLAQQQAVEKE